MPNWLVNVPSVYANTLKWVATCVMGGVVIAIIAIMAMQYELHTQWATLKKAPSTDQQNRVDGSNL